MAGGVTYLEEGGRRECYKFISGMKKALTWQCGINETEDWERGSKKRKRGREGGN